MSGHPWTRREVLLIRLLAENGFSADDAADFTRRSRAACQGQAHKLGVSFYPRSNIPVYDRITAAPTVPVTIPDRSWCQQCERLVRPNEASACHSRFCKAKEMAA